MLPKGSIATFVIDVTLAENPFPHDILGESSVNNSQQANWDQAN
jgi:hypothetical protein